MRSVIDPHWDQFFLAHLVWKNYSLWLTLTFYMERLNVFTKTPKDKTLKIFLSKIRRPGPLIFGM